MRPRHGTGRKQLWLGIVAGCLLGAAVALVISAQQPPAPVTVQVEIVRAAESARGTAPQKSATRSADASNVATWLIPLQTGSVPPAAASGRAVPQLIQRNKTFSPHVLVVQAGSLVQFPNQDPFFHNVFSLFAGKRFDLGLYEAGSSRAVRFDNPGASFLFCNIHPEMTAVIVVVPTPYYGLSDAAGRVTIAGVPDGRYQLKVWYERSSPQDLKSLEQTVTLSAASRSIGPIRISDNADLTLTHKNKYGQDYPPAVTNAAY
jgi:plastocyanin